MDFTRNNWSQNALLIVLYSFILFYAAFLPI